MKFTRVSSVKYCASRGERNKGTMCCGVDNERTYSFMKLHDKG